MTVSSRFPKVYVQGGLLAPEPLKRKHVHIPSMGRCAPKSKYTKETVVEIIVRRMCGLSFRALADEYGISEESIRKWCDGTLRASCLRVAEKEYRQMLKRGMAK